MKQVILRKVKNATSASGGDRWLMSLNRYLYTLKSISEGQMKIQNRVEFDGAVKFALMQELNHSVKNMIAITHD
jgi:hypothetical protein